MTDAIFPNVHRLNIEADTDPNTLRISVDTKATVYLGEYSRRGKSRGIEEVKALDHDMASKEKLIPGGILEPVSGQSFLFFGKVTKPVITWQMVWNPGGSSENRRLPIFAPW
jgi:Rhodopirellula transposase DDE domain